MKSEIQTGLYVSEGFLGYGLSELIPSNILLKKWNKLAVGIGISAFGAFVLKDKQGGNHVLALGLGATLNGILDGFGFANY